MTSCRRGAPAPGSSIERMQPLGVHHVGLAVVARDDAVAMQFLIPGWKFDNKRPALVR